MISIYNNKTTGSSLLKIPNLPFSTQVHHSTVTVLWIANYFQNIEIFHYWRGIVIYALFSILCGSVNGYLGFRIIFPDSIYRKQFKKFARYNYIICYSFAQLCLWIEAFYIICSYLLYQMLLTDP